MRQAAAASQESLLEAATWEFMERGFAGARVDAIARRARANKAMIYYHFRSKDGLYKAVLLRHFAGLLDEVERLGVEEPDPLRRLTAFYAGLARIFEERPALPRMMLREILAGGRHMAPEVRRTLGAIVAFVRRCLEQGAAQGALEPVHPWLLHVSVIAPLLMHAVTAPFIDRMLPAAVPGLDAPSRDARRAYVLRSLERALSKPGKEAVS